MWSFFLLFLSLNLCFPKIQKKREPFPNISFGNNAKYSPRQVSNETNPNRVGFSIFLKIKQKLWKIFIHVWKRLHHSYYQKWEANMVGVCLISNLTSKSMFWVLNHFLGTFAGWDIWQKLVKFWSIINFQCIFTY